MMSASDQGVTIWQKCPRKKFSGRDDFQDVVMAKRGPRLFSLLLRSVEEIALVVGA